MISAKSGHIFRIFPDNFLVYIRLNARAEDPSMNVLTLKTTMKVLLIPLFKIIFVAIYLPSKICQLYLYFQRILVASRCLAKSPCFCYGKTQNLKVLNISRLTGLPMSRVIKRGLYLLLYSRSQLCYHNKPEVWVYCLE